MDIFEEREAIPLNAFRRSLNSKRSDKTQHYTGNRIEQLRKDINDPIYQRHAISQMASEIVDYIL